MSKTQSTRVEFRVTENMVDEFAAISGDFNSMHVNPEVARKSKYRRTVVHGMIPYSFLQVLQNDYPDHDLVFTGFSTRFKNPVFTGDEINLEILHDCEQQNGSFEANWRSKHTNKLLITSSGSFHLVKDRDHTEVANTLGSDTFITQNLDENQYIVTDLDGKKDSILFSINRVSQQRYCDQILNAGLANNTPVIASLCKNLASVMLLSTMVGMRLPGRYAIFTQFDFEFKDNVARDHIYTLNAGVTKVSAASETMKAEVSINNDANLGLGNIVVLLNPPPKQMISSAEIVNKYIHFDLKDKVVLITGASRGIGETAAKLFAALGSRVVINYFRGKSDAEAIVDDIRRNGGQAICVQCDITDSVSVENMISLILDEFQTINVLVNNAVRDFSPKDITDMEWDDYLQEFDVSVKGLHACCKAVIPVFKDNGGGKIINLSTVAVDNPVPGQSRYITAKSAVTGYTKSLAKEVIKFNIQANLVVPNMTDTDLVSVLPTMYKDKIAESRAYGRHVYPVEVAQSIVFLASCWSDAITGQKIVLNLGEPPFA